jgi:uncharacterized protein (DUF3084 family)
MDDRELSLRFQNLETLIVSMKESFERELSPMKDALQRIEARLARQGGILQGGTRQVSRLITWSEDIDQMIAERDLKIEELSRRVGKLEGKLEGK